MSQKSTEIAQLDDSKNATPMARRVQPGNFAEMHKFAKMVVDSGLAPDSVDKASDAMLVMMKGAELGLPAIASLSSIYVVKGKTFIGAKTKIAIAQGHPDIEYIEIEEWNYGADIPREEISATFVGKKRGRKEMRFTYSVKQAIKAGLTRKNDSKSTWAKHPHIMVYNRAGATLADALLPGIMSGVYIPDEQNQAVVEAKVVDTTEDLNDRFSADNSEPEADEVIDAEFDEPDHPEADSEDDARAEQRRRLGQLIRHTDDLDTKDDKALIEKALRCAADKDDLESVDTKSLTLLINAIAKADGTADDGPSPRRLLLLEWAGVPLNGPDLDDEEFEV